MGNTMQVGVCFPSPAIKPFGGGSEPGTKSGWELRMHTTAIEQHAEKWPEKQGCQKTTQMFRQYS